MVEIKGIPPSLADKAKDAAKKDPNDTGAARNRDGQPKVRLARPDEEAKIKRNRRTGDWKDMARDDNDIERCRTAKDYETHTRLARPDEEDEIKAKHAKDRAEAAGQTNEAAASVARRQALGGV
jgi:hypothetical protein